MPSKWRIKLQNHNQCNNDSGKALRGAKITAWKTAGDWIVIQSHSVTSQTTYYLQMGEKYFQNTHQADNHFDQLFKLSISQTDRCLQDIVSQEINITYLNPHAKLLNL
jgi:hypothetical protein